MSSSFEMMSTVLLPEEIWVHVFGYLSSRDKLAVRCCCTCFKRLIDHWKLWINSVIVLQGFGEYDTQFWRTLRRRKIGFMVLQNSKARVFQQMVRWLPGLKSVTVSEGTDSSAMVALSALKHLERLVIRQTSCRNVLYSLPKLTKLTNLCLCKLPRISSTHVSATVSRLVNLNTLQYHEENSPLSSVELHAMLSCMPKLKHISLRLGPSHGILPDFYFGPVRIAAPPVLSSLELLNYEDPCLSSVALNPLPTLTKLTVHYTRWLEDATSFPCSLPEWLQGLSLLTELNVSLGYPLSAYAGSIPCSVQRVCLMGVKADLASVRIMGEQLPDLSHLHLDLCCHDISDIITEMPQIFPKLEILKVRHHSVPVSAFLQLRHLPRLQQLMILDAPQGSPFLRDLTQKLLSQKDNRFHVLSFDPKDQTSCHCGFY
ncbi:hypothetical protein DNTS_027315 [Danionella cerebrum]|uniref:F-box domain-containing protein n=1 Tax=Danionella cerebrum TaxID=2873325 RepID=A0A553QVS7_9TELE|nr:hypothetical protein DNTS_027315 [Danionella translucida]